MDGWREGGTVGFEAGLELRQCGAAVEMWFAETEEVEVGAVDHEDVFRHFGLCVEKGEWVGIRGIC